MCILTGLPKNKKKENFEEEKNRFTSTAFPTQCMGGA
jgi:hypothetical protein